MQKKILTLIAFIVLVTCLMLITCRAKGLEPPVEPNDAGFWYDPNLVTCPILDSVVSEPGEYVAYTIEYCSLAGVDVTLLSSEPNMTIERVKKYRDNKNHYWVQEFLVLWTAFQPGPHYIVMENRLLKNGRLMDQRMLLWCVEQGYMYPGGHRPMVSTVGTTQQIVQRAIKLGRYSRDVISDPDGNTETQSKVVHRWN